MGAIATLCRRNVYGDGEFNPRGATGAAKKHLGEHHGLEDTENRRDLSRHGNQLLCMRRALSSKIWRETAEETPGLARGFFCPYEDFQ